jgi:hypothetical protein
MENVNRKKKKNRENKKEIFAEKIKNSIYIFSFLLYTVFIDK